MYSSIDIANVFVQLAYKEEKLIRPMKLLKLTYIAYGYYYAFFDKPLFHGRIEAWKYGPVIPELYDAIKMFGKKPVEPFYMQTISTSNVDSKTVEFLASMWKFYKNFDGLQLSSRTHEEGTPWHKTWDGTRDKAIEADTIKEYYSELISNNVK
ncbi:Panacea domain-containing protein [Flammeovirga aprica]|uniref:DUF4065 domain-containing protein n=1 Tax=Flammeovirga aprica JL-4 TaxID=694437 RepID=A0A7X9P0T1_9BACT|nr:type II toxin-antitoxin system antitoxin SocA domain-containing protein [Flammeovirga aprica]NME67220.1 DUF4065 domain-containing protein [Flammeovirga aprica JL-4]